MKAIRRLSFGLLAFVLVLNVSTKAYSVTGGDKSFLLEYITNNSIVSNWQGTNFGFTLDERLIDNNWTLTYPVGSTNSSVPGLSQIILKGNTNMHSAESNGDSIGLAGDPVSEAEIHAIWVTWDTNGLYWALKGESKGRGNNLIFMLDRVPNVGANKMADTQSTDGWKRKVNLENWDIDLYLGFWCDDNFAKINTWQMFETINKNPAVGLTTYWIRMNSQDQNGNFSPNAGYEYTTNNHILMRYNGEFDAVKENRVALGFISWTVITNGFSPSDISNMNINIGSASTGPDDNDGGKVYDFCPDNLGGLSIQNSETFSENFFTINVFSNGNLVTGTSPTTNAYVQALPDSVYISGYAPTKFGSAVDNFGNVTSYLVPSQGGTITLQVPDIADTGYIGQARVRVYDLQGRLVRNLFDATESLTDLNIDTYLTWDGTDNQGQVLGMGQYIIILSGFNPVGDPIKLKYYINILR